MLTTTNYGLKKPEGTDVVDIQNFNDNTDVIDQALKKHDTALSDMVYQTASGSATAITLTIKGKLLTGYPITFIASANNGGAATTINGKKLYKPGTTVSPNLIAGKAYTVWYNSTGDCFFIKASAEGTALASDVRKNKTFSNDNDTGIVGGLDLSLLVSGNIRAGITIDGVAGKSSVVDTQDANASAGQILNGQTAYINGNKVAGNMPNHSGADSSANSIAGTSTGRIYVRPQAGYYDGSVASYVDDGNFNPANIIAGKSIFGLSGTAIRSTYTTGVCTKNVAVELGFRPKFVVIDGNFLQVYSEYNPSLNMGFYKYTGNGSGSSNNFISISDTGFTSTGGSGKFICC
jgi:hypothetical protein